ncbi:ATP-binding protein [Streptomyces sp. NPDC048638]|uniref:ATP-binding protein n=1 Tax=Streptomyces sp. NPDC048638 TaxID=3365580 RepID=UPI00371D1421
MRTTNRVNVPEGSVRHKEVDDLLWCLDTDPGTITELVGDPGTGKTRMLADLSNEAGARGIQTLTACGTEIGRAKTFDLFIQIISTALDSASTEARAAALPVLRELTAGRPGQDGLDSLPASVRALLQEWARRPLVVILDDFHWADAGSEGIIDHMLRRPVETAPLHLVIAQRPRQASLRLRGSIADRAELGHVRIIELGPFGADQSAELLGLPAGDERAERLHHESHGIPLYLQLLADAPHHAPLTGKVTDRLATRLMPEIETLTEQETVVAHAGAVLGDRFDLDMLAHVAQMSPKVTGRAIDGLCRRDLLRSADDPASLRFRHPLIGRLLYSQTGWHWRTHAHSRVGKLLAGQGATATERAWHIERGPAVANTDDVAVLAQAAAERMSSDPDSAARWLKGALRRLPRSGNGHNQRVELLLALARTHISAGRTGPARELIRDIVGGAKWASYPVGVEAIAFCAILEAACGHDSAAGDQLAVELDTLPAEKQAEVVPLLLARSTVAFLSGHLDDADDLAIALRLARKHHMSVAEAGALVLRGFRHILNNEADEAEQALAPGRAILDASPDVALAEHPEYLAVLGWAEILNWRFDDALRHLSRGASVMRRRGGDHLLPLVINGLSYAYQQVGRLVEAQKVLIGHQPVLETFATETQRTLASALEKRVGILTEGAHYTGSGSRVHLETSGEIDPRSSDWSRLAALCLADAARLAGRFEPSAALVLRAGGGPELLELPTALLPIAFEALTAASLHVQVPVPRSADTRMPTAFSHHRAHVLLAQAHVAKGGQDYRTAALLYRNAATLFSTAGMLCAQARALLPAAQCAAEDSRPDDAMALLTEAEYVAGQCESSRISQEVGERRRQLEGMPPVGEESALEKLAELTVREREVADLAASGVRTREIAERLMLSPRTIDVHLTRIYRKLGVKSRVALAGLLAARP